MAVRPPTKAFDNIHKGDLVKITTWNRGRGVITVGVVVEKFEASGSLQIQWGSARIPYHNARKREEYTELDIEIIHDEPVWIEGWVVKDGEVIDKRGNIIGKFFKGQHENTGT